MGEYRESEWYDDNVNVWIGDRAHYGPVYNFKHWWSLRFKKTWDLFTQDKNIIEVGHGAGTFAAFGWHHGHRSKWVGVDFGSVGQKMAIKGNKQSGHQNAHFYRADFLKKSFGDIIQEFAFDTHGGDARDWMIIGMEILEHLPNDRELVRSIPEGMEASFTVPGFDANGHLRYFPESSDSIGRYGPCLDKATHEWIKRPLRGQRKWHHHIHGWGLGQ